MRPGWRFELEAQRQGYSLIAGIDEAGCGPLAGPVVASAVILPKKYRHPYLNDSKQVTAKRRAEVAAHLRNCPDVLSGIGFATVEEIDSINILQARLLAMKRALSALLLAADYALVDGKFTPDFGIPCRAIIKGDAHSRSIAAASILAKEERDAYMCRIAEQYPEYGFEVHKGYGTSLHQERLRKYGPSPIHRRSFLPVRSLLGS